MEESGQKIGSESELGLTYLVHQMGIVLQELQDIILDAFHDIGDSRFAKTGLPEKTDRNDREKKGTGSHDSSKGSDSHLPENKTLMLLSSLFFRRQPSRS